MRERAVLYVAGDAAVLHVAPRQGVRAQLVRYLKGARGASGLFNAQGGGLHTWTEAAASPENIPKALERLVQAASERPSLRGADLDVQIGLRYCRLGLLHAPGVRRSLIDRLAHSWAHERFRLGASPVILRWEALAQEGSYLVSCVDRTIFEAIEACATSMGMSLASFRPAALNALQGHLSRRKSPPLVMAWTEPSMHCGRYGTTQFFEIAGGALTREWRAWMPSDAGSEEPDPLLSGAICRFLSMTTDASTQSSIERWAVPGLSA